MEFNITGVENVFLAVNTATHVIIFFLLVLPLLILSILCIAALIFTKDVNNNKIKVLLISVLAPDIGIYIAYTGILLGFPLRFTMLAGINFTCSLWISVHSISTNLKFVMIALYAVTIYTFIKHGDKKLKWYVIIPCIVIPWIAITLIFGPLPFLSEYSIANINGFCDANPRSLIRIIFLVLVTIPLTLISIVVVIVSSVLTFVYIKHNTLVGNIAIKKTVRNFLVYLMLYVILSCVTTGLSAAFIQVRETTSANLGITGQLLADYAIRVFVFLNNIPTPVAATILLKPIRDGLKAGGVVVCCSCKKNRLDSAAAVETTRRNQVPHRDLSKWSKAWTEHS